MSSTELLLFAVALFELAFIFFLLFIVVRLFRLHVSKMLEAKRLFESIKPALRQLEQLLKEKANEERQQAATGNAAEATVH